MTLQEIDELNVLQPYCFKTDREEDWYKCGLVEGADVARREIADRATQWLTDAIIKIQYRNEGMISSYRDIKRFINDFKKAIDL